MSSPPVLSMACRIASARALKADSALDSVRPFLPIAGRAQGDIPVMIVLATENIDV